MFFKGQDLKTTSQGLHPESSFSKESTLGKVRSMWSVNWFSIVLQLTVDFVSVKRKTQSAFYLLCHESLKQLKHTEGATSEYCIARYNIVEEQMKHNVAETFRWYKFSVSIFFFLIARWLGWYNQSCQHISYIYIYTVGDRRPLCMPFVCQIFA